MPKGGPNHQGRQQQNQHQRLEAQEPGQQASNHTPEDRGVEEKKKVIAHGCRVAESSMFAKTKPSTQTCSRKSPMSVNAGSGKQNCPSPSLPAAGVGLLSG